MEETGHFCEVLTFRVSKVSFFNYDFKPVLCLIEFLKIDVSSCTAFEGKRALRRNLAERAIDGVFSDRGFSIDWAV